MESFLRLLYLDTLPPKTDQGALCVLADLLYANELGPRALGRRYARTTVGQTVGDPVGCDAAI